MTVPVNKPEVGAELDDLKRRVLNLERALRTRAAIAGDLVVVPFSHATAPTEGGLSLPFYAGFAFLAYELHVAIQTPGSTASVVTAYINGAPFETITLAAAAGEGAVGLGQNYLPSDYAQVAVTTLGTGAEGFVVQIKGRTV